LTAQEDCIPLNTCSF